MSGVNDIRDASPGRPDRPASGTPRALADLAASLDETGASQAVARALDEAWHARHGGVPPSRRRRPWVWPALGAAAAVVVAVTLGTAGRHAPSSASHDAGAAAVPGGPFEPPPSRTTRVSEPGASDAPPLAAGAGQRPVVPASGPPPSRSRARQDVMANSVPAATVASSDESDPFVWIRGADGIEPGLGLQIVRVHVPRLRWEDGLAQRELIEADVLMGQDGQARAVRVVRTGGR